ncbi:hypothetical protein C8R42DRAFT_728594 [Lentinula raphanica]|nr:hypothetical protein C8R42DRAFT_728594 [Lentinula raphanica]
MSKTPDRSAVSSRAGTDSSASTSHTYGGLSAPQTYAGPLSPSSSVRRNQSKRLTPSSIPFFRRSSSQSMQVPANNVSASSPTFSTDSVVTTQPRTKQISPQPDYATQSTMVPGSAHKKSSVLSLGSLLKSSSRKSLHGDSSKEVARELQKVRDAAKESEKDAARAEKEKQKKEDKEGRISVLMGRKRGKTLSATNPKKPRSPPALPPMQISAIEPATAQRVASYPDDDWNACSNTYHPSTTWSSCRSAQATTAFHGDVTPTAFHDNATTTEFHDDATTTEFHDDATTTEFHNDTTTTRNYDNATTTAFHGDAAPTAFHDDATTAASHDDAATTAFHDDATTAAFHDDAATTAFPDDATTTAFSNKNICFFVANRRPAPHLGKALETPAPSTQRQPTSVAVKKRKAGISTPGLAERGANANNPLAKNQPRSTGSSTGKTSTKKGGKYSAVPIDIHGDDSLSEPETDAPARKKQKSTRKDPEEEIRQQELQEEDGDSHANSDSDEEEE